MRLLGGGPGTTRRTQSRCSAATPRRPTAGFSGVFVVRLMEVPRCRRPAGPPHLRPALLAEKIGQWARLEVSEAEAAGALRGLRRRKVGMREHANGRAEHVGQTAGAAWTTSRGRWQASRLQRPRLARAVAAAPVEIAPKLRRHPRGRVAPGGPRQSDFQWRASAALIRRWSHMGPRHRTTSPGPSTSSSSWAGQACGHLPCGGSGAPAARHGGTPPLLGARRRMLGSMPSMAKAILARPHEGGSCAACRPAVCELAGAVTCGTLDGRPRGPQQPPAHDSAVYSGIADRCEALGPSDRMGSPRAQRRVSTRHVSGDGILRGVAEWCGMHGM